MIPVLIFYIHTIFAVYVFVRTNQREGLLQAFLNIAFIIILFSVGWTISDLFAGIFISESGYSIQVPTNKIFFTFLKLSGFFKPGTNGWGWISPKDSISLIMLCIIEFLFYRFYFKSMKVVNDNA